MNTSVIRYRVADFLKRHAPFDSVPEAELLELAGKGRVKFHEADEYVHHLGQGRTPFVWVIQQGRVELIHPLPDERRLLDVLGPGDILGLDRFVGDGAYRSSACTASDVVLYAIDASAFEQMLALHPAVERFLAAHFSVSAAGSGRHSWLDAEPPSPAFLAARPVHAGHGFPSLPADFSTRQAVLTLLRHGAPAATVDGAMLSAADLALFCNADPFRLLGEIRGASSAGELGPLLRLAGRLVLEALARSSDVDDCSVMATEFVAAATAAAIRLAERDAAEAGIAAPETRFAWFAYGALARGELLRLVPPKIGVVFDDSPLRDPTSASIYGAVVAGRVADWLHRIGLHGPEAQWPQGSHPCMPLSEWQHFFRATIRNPVGHDIFSRREFFDMRPLRGDASLIGETQAWLRDQLSQSDRLVPLLASDTLGNLPPLTFFSGLVVALDGSEHHALDLARTALFPISDAARVFALSAGLPAVNTLERLAAAAALSGAPDVFRDAAEAYRISLYHQALAGSGSIDPTRLARLDQRLLKTAFQSVLRLLELTTRTFVTPA
jgi:signal-transduction protein with cAMP-binding, CBS, and nucleotidyltransferase domain